MNANACSLEKEQEFLARGSRSQHQSEAPGLDSLLLTDTRGIGRFASTPSYEPISEIVCRLNDPPPQAGLV